MTLARPAVLLLAAGHGLAMIDRNLLAVAATPVARSLGLGDSLLGLLLGTAFALPYAAAAVPLGRFADHGRARALLVGGALVWTIASLIMALVRSPAEIVAARVLLGLGQAAFVPAALALLVAGETSARRLALFTGASTLGRSIALLGGGALLGVITTVTTGGSWRALFVVTAMPNLLLIAALMMVRLPPATWTTARRSAGDATALPRLLLFLAAACAPIVAGQASIAWMPTLLVRLQGFTPGSAGVLAGGVALVAAPGGQLLAGMIARRSLFAREHPLVAVPVGLWAALPPLLLIVEGHSPLTAAIGLAGVNMALGAAAFAAIFGWQALWPAGRRGFGNGAFMATITLVGVGAGPLLAGLLSERAGGGIALAAALLTIGAGAALLASGVAMAMEVLGRPVTTAIPA